jgi:hypothetical protein
VRPAENDCARRRTPTLLVGALALALIAMAFSGARGGADETQTTQIAGHQWGVTGIAAAEEYDDHAVAGLLAGLGATSARPTVCWDGVQPEGPDGWDWSRLDRLFQAYRESGRRAWVLIESGSADWATDTGWLNSDSELGTDCPPRALPRLDEPITGTEPYYVFVRELVARYHDVASAWLIDNEASEPWSYAGDAYTYACLARLAANAIHDADPDAVAVLGAIPVGTAAAMVIGDRLDDPSQEAFIVSFASRMWGYPLTISEIQAIFDAPQFRAQERVNFYRQALAVLPEVDAVAGNVLSIHARGELAADIAWAYSDQMLTHGEGLRPLIYTEINPYMSDEMALAQQTTQLMIGSLATGSVVGQAYHEFIDDSVERVPEPNCGLVTGSLEPKAGYFAYRTLISLLRGAETATPLSLPQPLHGYRFVTDRGATIDTLWAEQPTTVDPAEYAPSEVVALYDMLGGQLPAATDGLLVTPSPVYIVAGPPGMADVPPDHWAYDSIWACVDAGVVAGYPDGTYQPEGTVTRDQMAVFISRGLAGGDANVPPGPSTASFLDVPVDHWAFTYVEYAGARDIVSGYSTGLYYPEAAVDRGQMAVFIARALAGGDDGVPNAPAEPTFDDVTPTSDWAWCQKYIEYIVGQGIASGYPDGLYHPDCVCARDQMAVYLARAFDLPEG